MPEVAPERRAPRALLVDDDPVVRLLASQALEGVGFAVAECESGSTALDSARETPPDLVVLDLLMPGLDGFETCARLRALPELRDVPILVATGLTDAATIDRAYEAGASEFIKKPIDWQLFQHRVRFMMRAHGAFRELSRTLDDLVESRQRLASAHRIARIGHYDLEAQSGEMIWSEELWRLAALPGMPAEPGLSNFLALVHPEDRPAVEKAVQEAGLRGGFTLEHRIVTGAGTTLVVWHQAERSSAPHRLGRIEGTIQDVTEKRRTEERLRFLAYYDPLTQLPNRNHLRERLRRVLDRAQRDGQSVSLLCVDLDRFHRINDTLGRTMGDELLRQVAERLRECVRATDFIGRPSEANSDLSRLGGDDFTLLLADASSEHEARGAARRLLRAFDAAFEVHGRAIPMEASIGIAMTNTVGYDPELLLQRADLATTRAKRAGSGSVCVYESAMNDATEQRFELENALRVATERKEFFLDYQPLVSALDGRILGMEALLRWRHPVHGQHSPTHYVPVAEELGLIVPIGEWVLDEACRQLRAWSDEGLPPVRLSVNISPVFLDRRDLVSSVTAALARHDLPPQRLEIELTESALVDETERAADTLRRLRQLGVGIAMDDFGTGYSSLARVVQLPISRIKIDRAFVAGIGRRGSGIIAAVMALSRHLQVDVVAEGVETEAQEAFLRAEGCGLLQGFRYSRPIDPDSMAALLRSGEPLPKRA